MDSVLIVFMVTLHGVFARDAVPICSDHHYKLVNTQGASFFYNSSVVGFKSCACTMCDVTKISEEKVQLTPKQILFTKSGQKFEFYRPHGENLISTSWQNNSGEPVKFSIQIYCMNLSLTLNSGAAYITVEANFSDQRENISVVCLTEGKLKITDTTGGGDGTQTGKNQSNETITIAVACTVAVILVIIVCVVLVLLIKKSREMSHLRASMLTRSNDSGNKRSGHGGLEEYNPYITSRVSYSNNAYEDIPDIIPTVSSKSTPYQYQEAPNPPDPHSIPKYRPDQSEGTSNGLSHYDNMQAAHSSMAEDNVYHTLEHGETSLDANGDTVQTHEHETDESTNVQPTETSVIPNSEPKEQIVNALDSGEEKDQGLNTSFENSDHNSLGESFETGSRSPTMDEHDSQENTIPIEPEENAGFYYTMDIPQAVEPQPKVEEGASDKEVEESNVFLESHPVHEPIESSTNPEHEPVIEASIHTAHDPNEPSTHTDIMRVTEKNDNSD